MKHLTYTDRLVIEKLYNSDPCYSRVAKQLKRSVSSIWSEIQRGLYDHLDSKTYDIVKRYSADKAQEDADYRATAKGKPIALGNNYAYAREISERIQAGESPDSIVGDKRLHGEWTVSTPTLYRYIDAGYIPGITNANLTEKPKRKRKYHKVKRASRAPAGASIESRPPEIASRTDFGHWEMDSVIGKAKGRSESILVLTERKTRFEIILCVKSKEASETVKALNKAFKKYGNIFKSITVDNGSEFADCYGMEHDSKGNKRTTVYYCHPYSSWERGSNENCNRIIRRFFPKHTSLKNVTQKVLDKAQAAINAMPRKILGYHTAQELFERELKALVVA